MKIRTFHDIYRCPYCASVGARGNRFCRGCGIEFKESDISNMERCIHSAFGATPWNTRDRFRCLLCGEFVCIEDKYCRGCGDYFDDMEKHMMKAKVSELAKQNTPSLIGLGIFVVFVILGAIQIVR